MKGWTEKHCWMYFYMHVPSTYFDIREDAATPHRPQQEKVAVGNGPLQEDG